MQLLMALPSPSPSLCAMQHRPAAFSTVNVHAHGFTDATPFQYYSGGPYTKKKKQKQIRPGRLRVARASDAKRPPDPSSSPFAWGIGERELRGLQRATRLHLAITNRSVRELLGLIGDECQYYCCSIFAQLNPIILAMKVLEVLHHFMAKNNVTFVVKPNTEHGVDLGIRWVLVTGERHWPLGIGCSIYTKHFYEGEMFVRNARVIMDSLQHLGPLTLQKMDDGLLLMIDKLLPKGIAEGKRSACKYCFLSLLVMSISLLLLKNTFV